MRRLVPVMLGAATLVAGATACGGGGGTRYEESGLDITFTIPSGFHIGHDISVSKSAGARPVDRAAVSLDRDNLIIVQRYDLNAAITSSNLSRYKSEVDDVVGNLAEKEVSGRRVEYGGLPGYEYVISLDQPARGESRLAVLFDGDVEYLVNCQSTPGRREAVEKGCRTVLDSIEQL